MVRRGLHECVVACVVGSAAVLATAGTGTNGTELVSVDSMEASSNGTCYESSVSDDGRFVAFRSDASNLDPRAADTGDRIYLRDRILGTTTLVSTDGESAPGGCYNPKVSANGRIVLFQSYSGIDPLDDNGRSDLYAYDTKRKSLRLVSGLRGGELPDGDVFLEGAALSANGRFVACYSAASNLAPSSEGGLYQVYLLDTRKRRYTLCSRNAAGDLADDHALRPSISANGKWVVFDSFAGNLVAESVANSQVYEYGVKKRSVRLVTKVLAGGGDADSFGAVVANSGRVVYRSAAGNLLGGVEPDSAFDLFVYTPEKDGDSVGKVPAPVGGTNAGACAVTADGLLVLFRAGSPMLEEDDNDEDDVYSFDLADGTLRLVSRTQTGNGGNNASDMPAGGLSPNGAWVSYSTDASDLVDADGNGGARDVMVVDPRR